MDYMNLGPAEMLTIAIIAGAFVAGAIGLLGYKIMSASSFSSGHHQHEAYEAFDEFVGKIRLLEQKQSVLSDFSEHYFNTLQEAGWEKLVGIIDTLQSVEGELNIMLDQKRYADVKGVCDYLLGHLEAQEAHKVVAEYEVLSELQNWRQTSREILLRIIQATTDSPPQSQELGTARKNRIRKPTLISLSDLRGSLGDF